MDESKYQVRNDGQTPGQVIGDQNTIAQTFYVLGSRPAHPAPPEHIWNVPYRRNPFFTGREDELNRLHEQFTQATTAAPTQPLAVTGLGGVGKTQVTVEYAYRHREEYRYILWVNASTRSTIISSFLELAGRLDLPEKQEQDQNKVVNAVKDWLTEHNQWLLIFDNADDLALAEEFLPTSDLGSLLFTTRNQAPGVLADSLDIEAMDKVEGTLLVLRRAKMLARGTQLEQAKPENRAQAERIVDAMGGLPLALDQAAAYIEETQCTLADFLEKYQRQRDEVLRRRGGTGKDHPLPVATTWSLSFAEVQQLSPIAADLLRMCTFLAPDAIPEELIVGGAAELGPLLEALENDATQLNEAIWTLHRFSLIRRHREEHTVSVHRLVQAALLMDMDELTRKLWAERIVRAVNRTFSSVEMWRRRQPYLPHAQVCVALIAQWQMAFAEATQLLYHIGCHFLELGDYFQAEQPLAQALAIRKQTLGAEHPDTIQCLSKIADLYYYQGKYPEAIALHEQVLALRRRTLSPEHSDIAQSLNDLGFLYYTLGEYPRAESLLTQAVEMRDQVLEPGHPDKAESFHNLASLYTVQRKYDQAEPLFKRALAIHEQTPGSTRPDVASGLLNLAQLYSDQRDYTQAEPLLKRALALREQVLGPDHPDVAQCLNSLALLYYEQGNYGQAEPLCERALTIRQQTLKPNHPDVAQSLNVLGLLYHVKKEYAQAEKLFLQALAIREQALGPHHPKVALTLTDLASLYTDQERYLEAEPLFKRALAIYEQTPDLQHSDATTALEQYASLLRRVNRENEAVM